VKLATFVNPYTGEERMGILLADGEDPLILDANALAEKKTYRPEEPKSPLNKYAIQTTQQNIS
jgi:hypothetical protein